MASVEDKIDLHLNKKKIKLESKDSKTYTSIRKLMESDDQEVMAQCFEILSTCDDDMATSFKEKIGKLCKKVGKEVVNDFVEGGNPEDEENETEEE